jgi:hypothetical protein
MRHAATQEDGLSRYGWLRHDGEQYGRQTLVDKDYNISLTMVCVCVYVCVSSPSRDCVRGFA